ncbi:MAG TPA: hypothetical protein VFN42_03020 [Acetobacteraceae bacterium]|nr:hypothetical protein [Acetobacteraceae bacterium]
MRRAQAEGGAATAPYARFLVSWATAFVVTFVAIWLYVATCPMAFLDRDYPLWRAKRAMLDQCRAGTVAVFGDSRAVAGIMPGVMPLRVTNFALSGTSPIETYFAVRRALRCPTPPRLVVIAHGALKFSADADYWRFGARTGFFRYDDMRRVDGDAARLHDDGIERLTADDHLQPWLRDRLYAVRLPMFYFSSLLHGYVAARWRHNLAAEEDALQSYGHALFGTAAGSSGIASEAGVDEFRASSLINLYYTRTLAMLQARHVAVVVLTMPVNQATYMQSQPQFRGQFAAYLHAEAASFDNVNLSASAIGCWPDAYYGDAWHFNAVGAAVFSRAFGVFLVRLLHGEPAEAPLHRCVEVPQDRGMPPGRAGRDGVPVRNG